MGTKEIKQKIEINENNVKTRIEILNDIREKIVEETKPFLSEQLRQLVESEVKRNPKHTMKLGKETLSEMKKRLFDLLSISNQIVDRTFEDDGLWMHVNCRFVAGGDRFGQRYNSSKKAKDNIHKGIRIVLGEAGRILADFKYSKVSKIEQYGHYGSQWKAISDDRIIYTYGLSLPIVLEDLIKQYTKELEQLHDFVEKVHDLKDKLLEQEAFNLWDEA